MKLSVALFLFLALPAHARTDQDLESTFNKLKQAEASRDATLVRVLAMDVYRLTAEENSTSAPEGEAAQQYAEKLKVWLADVRLRTEYAVYSTALVAKPDDAVALLVTLEQLNPRSQYLDLAYPAYFVALQRSGQASRITVVAQEALKYFPENEDLLLVLADAAMAKSQTDRAAMYAERLIAVLGRHSRPDGYSVQDWTRKRELAGGRARWIAGVAHSAKQQYGEADKDLRIALPIIRNDAAVLASTLFHLGVANYQIGATMLDKARMLEAAKFSDQAAAIPGPLSQQAWRNAHAMRQEAQKLR